MNDFNPPNRQFIDSDYHAERPILGSHQSATSQQVSSGFESASTSYQPHFPGSFSYQAHSGFQEATPSAVDLQVQPRDGDAGGSFSPYSNISHPYGAGISSSLSPSDFIPSQSRTPLVNHFTQPSSSPAPSFHDQASAQYHSLTGFSPPQLTHPFPGTELSPRNHPDAYQGTARSPNHNPVEQGIETRTPQSLTQHHSTDSCSPTSVQGGERYVVGHTLFF